MLIEIRSLGLKIVDEPILHDIRLSLHETEIYGLIEQDGGDLMASRFAGFVMREKPVVESGHVLLVAFGVPGVPALLLFGRWRRG